MEMKSDIDLIICSFYIFLREKYSTWKIKQSQEKATVQKLIHCNDVRTMFAYFQIVNIVWSGQNITMGELRYYKFD